MTKYSQRCSLVYHLFFALFYFSTFFHFYQATCPWKRHKKMQVTRRAIFHEEKTQLNLCIWTPFGARDL